LPCARDAPLAGLACVEAEHRADEDATDAAHGLAVVRDARSELKGQREHVLSKRHAFGQHVVHQVGGALRYSTASARGTVQRIASSAIIAVASPSSSRTMAACRS
jgi:hypothetical protein